jgi:hypothetical protein
MLTIEGAPLSGLTLTLLMLGALAALTVGLLVLAFLRPDLARRLLLPVAALAIFGLGIIAIVDRMAEGERFAERRALAQRNAQLTGAAMAPGSTLACLDGAAGETVENACERTVFGGPQSTAAAVAYMAARLTLLSDAFAFARHSDPDFAVSLAGLRRAIELDRFGIAAHVLAVRDGCTAERCDTFALLGDTNVIKSNLKAQVFDQYVSRYAANWNKNAATAPVADRLPGAMAPVAILPEAPAKAPVPDKYDLPSSASIPPVSIMNPEPPLPKAATDAQAAQDAGDKDAAAPGAPKPRAPAALPPAR